MRENRITRTIEEVNGYYAEDGQWFKDKAECEKYEQSAKMVLYGMLKDNRIGITNAYALFENGCEDDPVEIYNIDSEITRERLNRYIILETRYNQNLITADMIGETIILQWGYDKEYCYCHGTIEDVLNDIKERYDKVVNPKTTEQK